MIRGDFEQVNFNYILSHRTYTDNAMSSSLRGLHLLERCCGEDSNFLSEAKTSCHEGKHKHGTTVRDFHGVVMSS
jgi:hypothetical protein